LWIGEHFTFVWQAADWWERAANEALERGAQLEALHLFGRAATLAEALHDNDQEANKVWRTCLELTSCLHACMSLRPRRQWMICMLCWPRSSA
jgi:hypothetical protein